MRRAAAFRVATSATRIRRLSPTPFAEGLQDSLFVQLRRGLHYLKLNLLDTAEAEGSPITGDDIFHLLLKLIAVVDAA